MDTILETNAAVESVRQAYDGSSDRPRPEWVRGTCPQCGDRVGFELLLRRRQGLFGDVGVLEFASATIRPRLPQGAVEIIKQTLTWFKEN